MSFFSSRSRSSYDDDDDDHDEDDHEGGELDDYKLDDPGDDPSFDVQQTDPLPSSSSIGQTSTAPLLSPSSSTSPGLPVPPSTLRSSARLPLQSAPPVHLFDRPNHSSLPWSIQLMRPLVGICCQLCGKDSVVWSKTPSRRLRQFHQNDPSWARDGPNHDEAPVDQNDSIDDANQSTPSHTNIMNNASAVDHVSAEQYDQQFLQDYSPASRRTISPFVLATMSDDHNTWGVSISTEQILHEYTASCRFYHVRPNSGVLAYILYLMPTMRDNKICPISPKQDLPYLPVESPPSVAHLVCFL